MHAGLESSLVWISGFVFGFRLLAAGGSGLDVIFIFGASVYRICMSRVIESWGKGLISGMSVISDVVDSLVQAYIQDTFEMHRAE